MAVLLVGGGMGAMIIAALQREVVLGVLGGIASFAGVLLAGVLVVPALVRLLGRLLTRRTWVPGRLAVDSAVRNPGRAASTSAALLVGVTLITMTTVGAATADTTAQGEIDAKYAVDATVVSQGQPLDPELADGLARVDGVEATAPMTAASLGVGTGGMSAEQQVLDRLQPGTIGASSEVLAGVGIAPGDTVTVRAPGGATMSARAVELGIAGTWVLQQDDLAQLSGPDRPVVAGTMLRLADDVAAGTVLSELRTLTDRAEVRLEGAATLRQELDQVLRTLVVVTVALLGVAVLIAVVGIANTLSLSVLERAREHALLRGLGLTRAQMRAMLLVEGVLLALVSAVLGVLLGLVYGWLGAQTVLPPGTTAALQVPWSTVATIVLAALVAGSVASVLPTRRATRITPAAGLATT